MASIWKEILLPHLHIFNFQVESIHRVILLSIFSLPLYCIERYHLRDFQGEDRPEGAKELFNYRHSSLRNVIERCFGVLKAQFPVLKMMPRYKPCR